ncbi:hypothetical protein PWT90_10709 [Aphanocladium album]|nr:hypothetical protein PWT90_10709 [Aphanocladium album]
MLSSAVDVLERVHYPPEDAVVYNIVDEYLQPLGFTLYRTDYSFSDENWQAFLERVNTDFREDFARCFEGEQQEDQEEIAAIEKLRNLLQLDVRSDSAFLNGRTMDELRTIFRESAGGRPINAEKGSMQYVLLADAEVLDAASRGEYWVKLVQINYDEDDYRPYIFQHPGPVEYPGWVMIATNSLLRTRVKLQREDPYSFLDAFRSAKGIRNLFPVFEFGKNLH